jgi:hypothetical protein
MFMKRTLIIPVIFFLAITTAMAQDSSSAAAPFLGKYKFPPGSVVPEVEVVVENGLLMMNSAEGNSSLELLKPDTFSIISFNGTAIFKRNEKNLVTGVHIEAMGYVLDGVRDSTALGKTYASRVPALYTYCAFKVVPEGAYPGRSGWPENSSNAYTFFGGSVYDNIMKR